MSQNQAGNGRRGRLYDNIPACVSELEEPLDPRHGFGNSRARNLVLIYMSCVPPSSPSSPFSR